MTAAPIPSRKSWLDPSFGFEAFARGLTPREHLERYGFDLAWIHVHQGRLRCSACGDRASLESGFALASVIAATFIERHARCVRNVAKPRRAA